MQQLLKAAILTMFVFGMAFISFSQSIETQSFKLRSNRYCGASPGIYFDFSKHRPFRHSTLRYYPTKVKNTHVISVSRSDRMFDDVYYVNGKGETEYRSIAITAPVNRFLNNDRKFDSFNPTGAESLDAAIVQGLFDTIFKQ